MNAAVDEGIPSAKWGRENRDFVDALKYNNAVFAAFKTHREQNDLHALLLDNEGKQKNFVTFKKDCQPVIGDYNNHWLKTEHDTAIKSARTAAKFVDFERDKDLYPNLKWMPSSAVEPRQSHRLYYNTVRRIGDRWFLTHYPGNEWGCQCDLQNTDAPITHRGDSPVNNFILNRQSEADAGLDKNPAYTKSIFSKSHPYVTEGYMSAGKLLKILLPKVEQLVKKHGKST